MTYRLTEADQGAAIAVEVAADGVNASGRVESGPVPPVREAKPILMQEEVYPQNIEVQFAGGNGTAANPYLVATAD